ncbi:MAG: ParA family protein [Candidatus Omnitrophota bacterium]|nr:MAG: ParA family protein [Candidatus Omnitrophota bacterium]
MSKIIGICNQKGGTGKTTTAVNLTTFLALAGKKTLLVDVDPQGNATSGLGKEVSSELPSIYQGLIEKEPPQKLIVSTSWKNLFLIPSSISLTGAEIELVSLEERESRLRRLLEMIRYDFEYIILDAPPSLGLLTVNVLVAADSLIIPIQCEYYALEGVSKLLNTIELVKERLNPRLEIEGVLLTMADFRTRLALQVIEEVKRFFKEKVFTTIIPRNVKLAEAPSFGKPILFYDPSCVGTKAYLNLTQEILKRKIDLDLCGSSLKEGG